MKTKSHSLSRILAALSLMLVAVLLTGYSLVANVRRNNVQEVHSEADVSPTEDDESDSEYLEKRREFLDQFFDTAPGGVLPSAYASALVAARALPLSPLLQGRKFVSPETLEVVSPWVFPIAPPIENSYGGNASARVQTLAIDPRNANVAYTGSFGGLAKTTDGGITWRYLSDAWASQSVSSIAVNPNAANHVYVGTGADPHFGVGLYRSFDRGTTWSNLGATQFGGTVIRAVAIGARTRSGSIVYVANGLSHNSGLWRSSDSGVTWIRLRQAGQAGSNTRYRGVHDVVIDPSAFPPTVYVTDDDGAFKSVDSGQTWTSIRSLPACVPHGACTFSRLSLANSALYLLAGVRENRNLYKYTTASETWTQIPTNCFVGADSCTGANIGFGVFAVDSANPQIILGGNQALYRTDNEGATWTEIGNKWGNDPDPARQIHTDQRVIAFSSITPAVVYEGNDGGIVRSTDAGQHWTNLNQNFPGALLYSVALSADGSLIAGTQDHGAVYSELGAAWYSFRDGDSNHDLIDPIGSTWAYKVGYTPGSFRRVNRQTEPYEKKNISPVQFILSEQQSPTERNDSRYEPCAFFPTFSMNPSSPTHVIAACQQVVRTLDATRVTPDGWTTIGQPLGDASGTYVTAAYEAPSNSDVIYAVVGHNRVWVTTTAGGGAAAIWNDVTPDLQGGIWTVTVHPTDPRTAYLARNSGVYKTTDLGTTWIQQGIPDLIYRDVAIDPANPKRIFVASYAGVLASTNGGSTWENMSDGIPAGMMVSSLSLNAISRQLAASTYGRGVYMLDLSETPRTSISSSANLATTSNL